MSGQRQIVAKATMLIVLSACSFGSLSTVTVLITRAGMPLLPAMFWRYLLAASALLLFLRGRAVRDVSRKEAIRLMVVGGIGQALITYLSLHALDFLPVGPLAFLFYTYPAWVAVISAALGREDLTLTRFIALSIAMLGIVVMVGTPGTANLNTFGISSPSAQLFFTLFTSRRSITFSAESLPTSRASISSPGFLPHSW